MQRSVDTRAPAGADTIKIGVTPGPHARILEADIEIVEFTGYVFPNAALDAGDIQASPFQNAPYLDHQKADRGYRIAGRHRGARRL